MASSAIDIRMKEYESRNQYYLQKRTPVIIRVDGRSFHTFSRGFKKPFDEVLMTSMQQTMRYMCENIQNAKFGYCESDEITIVLIDYEDIRTAAWFDYRTDKLCSIAASMATMAFNRFFAKNVEDWWYSKDTTISEENDTLYETYHKAVEKGAMFDARCFNIPKEEVANCVYWRQIDATRNSIQMVGQANFSHKELQGKSCNDIQDMLFVQKGINWNDFPTDCKRGAACYKVKVATNVSAALGIAGSVYRNKWIIDKNMPILTEDWNYINKYVFI